MLRFFKTHRPVPALVRELEDRLADLELTVQSHAKRIRRMQAHMASNKSVEVRDARNTEEDPNTIPTDQWYAGNWGG